MEAVRLDRATPARVRVELVPLASSTFRTAVEALRHNKLRAFLTSLGILFGVASVIAMLAIGKGAEREILEQLRLLGSNNRSEEHTSELQSLTNLVCRLLLEKKKKIIKQNIRHTHNLIRS